MNKNTIVFHFYSFNNRVLDIYWYLFKLAQPSTTSFDCHCFRNVFHRFYVPYRTVRPPMRYWLVMMFNFDKCLGMFLEIETMSVLITLLWTFIMVILLSVTKWLSLNTKSSLSLKKIRLRLILAWACLKSKQHKA